VKVQCGKVLKYLGMTLDFTTARQVKMLMFDYVDDLLRDYKKAAPDEHGTKTSAAPGICLWWTMTARSWIQRRLSSSTIWWPRLCLPPRERDQTPAQPCLS
jgi:hypothetical protein